MNTRVKLDKITGVVVVDAESGECSSKNKILEEETREKKKTLLLSPHKKLTKKKEFFQKRHLPASHSIRLLLFLGGRIHKRARDPNVLIGREATRRRRHHYHSLVK